jgi:hypothetical protein
VCFAQEAQGGSVQQYRNRVIHPALAGWIIAMIVVALGLVVWPKVEEVVTAILHAPVVNDPR